MNHTLCDDCISGSSFIYPIYHLSGKHIYTLELLLLHLSSALSLKCSNFHEKNKTILVYPSAAAKETNLLD